MSHLESRFHRSSPSLPIRSLLAVALVGTSACALASTWNVTNGLWNQSGNWLGGIPGAGGIALFSNPQAVPVNVDLAGTASGNATMDLSFTAGSYNLVDLAGTGSLTFRDLTHSSGSNSISARLISSSHGTVTGGTLSLTNTALGPNANTISGIWSVLSGGTLNSSFGGVKPVSGPSGTSALGAASLSMNGGGKVIFTGKPYDVPGGQPAQPQTVLGHNVSISGNATLVATNTVGITLGTFNTGFSGATLTIGDSAADGLVRFTNTNLEGSGVFNFQTNSDLALGKYLDGANAVQIVKTGGAAMILDDNTSIGDGTVLNVQAGTLRAAASGVLNTFKGIRLASGSTIDYAAANSFGAATPHVAGKPGSIIRVSHPAALGGSGGIDPTPFFVTPGQVLEVTSPTGLTGLAQITHVPGSITVSLTAGDTLEGSQVDNFPLGSDDLVQINSNLNGRGAGVFTGVAGRRVIMQITGADRNISQGGIRELRGQIITQDAGNDRTVLDGGGLNNAQASNSVTTLASARGQTLTIADNLTSADGMDIGTSRIIDGVARDGVVLLTNPANQFDPDFGPVFVRAGATLATTATASGASGFGPATGILGAQLSLVRGTVRVQQPAVPVSGASAFIENLILAGAGTLSVDRGPTAGTVTSAILHFFDTSVSHTTLALHTAHDSLGVDERIRFDPENGVQAYRTGNGDGVEIPMIQPFIYSTSGGTARFVDYDPTQNPTTGPGFTHAVMTPLGSDANFDAATSTTIGNVTVPVTLAGSRTVGALRVTANLSGTPATPLAIQTGGLIVASDTDTTISAPLDFSRVAGGGDPAFDTFPHVIAAGTGTHTLSGKITSSYWFTKAGPGTLALTADNSTTMNGNIYLNEGTLAVNSSESLGAIEFYELVFSGGTLRPTGTFDLGRFVRINSAGGTIEVPGGSVITASRQLLGTSGGSFTKSGAGTLALAFTPGLTSQDFRGDVFINGGTLAISQERHFGIAANTITINETGGTGARLRLGVNTARSITLVGANAGIDVPSGAEISGTITGPGGLRKTGPGNLTITSDRNGYLGGTVVAEGSLFVDTNTPAEPNYFGSTGSGPVTVEAGATFGGIGVVAGSITARTGSTIEPTAFPDPGWVLRAQAGLTLETDANFKWTFSLDDPQTSDFYASKLTIEDGALKIATGANFTFQFYGVDPSDGVTSAFWNSNRVFLDVIDVTGLGTIGSLGSFDIDNSPWAGRGSFATTTALGGVGVDLIWTAVPEPTSLSSLLSGVGVLLGLRRPRRRG